MPEVFYWYSPGPWPYFGVLITTVDNARPATKSLIHDLAVEPLPGSTEEGYRPRQKSLLDILKMNEGLARQRGQDETERE